MNPSRPTMKTGNYTLTIIKPDAFGAGKTGKIEDIRDGVFSLPKRALVSFDERTVELPVEMVMVVGKDKPVIKVN